MAVYYVSTTGTPSGDGSKANPWDLQTGFDSLSAGDELRILNDGTYLPTAGLVWDTAVGQYLNSIVVRGRNAADTAYERVIISGANLPASTNLLTFTLSPFAVFQDLRLTAATANNVSQTISGVLSRWVDCRFDNAAASGMYLAGMFCVRCEFDHNGASGFSAANYYPNLYRCRIHHNSGWGMSLSTYGIAQHCSIYRNGSGGIGSVSWRSVVTGCTIDNNGGDGIYLSEPLCTITDNILSNNSGYGIYGRNNAGEPGHVSNVSRNLYYNNSSGNANLWAGFEYIEGQDPLFVSTTDGSEDYRLKPGSPARNVLATIPGAAANNPLNTYPNIGAWQHVLELEHVTARNLIGRQSRIDPVGRQPSFNWLSGRTLQLADMKGASNE